MFQVTQLSMMLDALIEKEIEDVNVLECYFIEALYCSLGATLLEGGRIKFDEYVKRLASMTTVYDEKSLAGPGELPGEFQHSDHCHKVTVPSEHIKGNFNYLISFCIGHLPTIYDFHFDGEKKKWIPWSKLVPKYIHKSEEKFIDILGRLKAQ